MSDTDVDFTITVSIPESELRNPGSKQYTAYHVQVTSFSCKTQRSMEWRVLRRYSEFLGLYQQLRKGYPKQFLELVFPSKRMIGRFNPEFVERRREQLQHFLEKTMEHPEIINSSPELRAFVEIDKNLTLVMEKEKEDLKSMVEQAIADPIKQQQLQFARCLFDFEARNEEELALSAGDILVVTDTRDNNGWWQGQFHGRCGFFPINYVEMLDEVPDNVEEIIRGTTSPPPVVPSPAVPNRLSMAVQEKRRTNLLDKMTLEKALAAQATAEENAQGDMSRASICSVDSTCDEEAERAAIEAEKETVAADAAADVGDEARAEKAANVEPEAEHASSAAADDAGESGPVKAEEKGVGMSATAAASTSAIEAHPQASLDSNGLMYVRGVAKYAFKGESTYELSFNQGDEVDVYTIDHTTGWWQGRSSGNIGYFPGTYVDVPEFAEDVLPVEKEGDDEEEAKAKEAAAEASVASGSIDEEVKKKHERLTQLGAKIVVMPSQEEVTRTLEKRKTRQEQATKVKPLPQQPKTEPADPSDAGLACILCVCEHWHPLEWEQNMCKNCRHLKKMHRAKRS